MNCYKSVSLERNPHSWDPCSCTTLYAVQYLTMSLVHGSCALSYLATCMSPSILYVPWELCIVIVKCGFALTVILSLFTVFC